MHRIDTPTAQKDKFGAGKNGFTRGNPQTGTPATDLDDDYFDMLQEELAGIVEAAGITLDKSKRNQLRTALPVFLGLKTAALRDVGAGANQIPDMSLFASIREAKGYQRLPGGMIIQWGRVNVVTANTSSDVIIDQFKIPFPGAALQCFATVEQTQVNIPCFACAESINQNEIRLQAVAINITNKTITQGQIVPVSWYAVGY
ncbi:gp53-like domain-containing protein [Leclercia adecarboxylata]|uniref:gp53-like domain-containing protein n=1 Tax=Leclercia adecarboxylata TaxID=83655 RepID=UPI001F496D4E|nr:hypothetical protein [Leclercia adecarboxylata]MDU1652248.1 hypothetical protein [Leclercia adecarboxylata]MDU2019244.1 hypothetical protein [Leclercia adecarboxylata]